MVVVGVMEGQAGGAGPLEQHPGYYMALCSVAAVSSPRGPLPGSCWFEWQKEKGLVSAVPWDLSIEYHLHSLSF